MGYDVERIECKNICYYYLYIFMVECYITQSSCLSFIHHITTPQTIDLSIIDGNLSFKKYILILILLWVKKWQKEDFR